MKYRKRSRKVRQKLRSIFFARTSLGPRFQPCIRFPCYPIIDLGLRPKTVNVLCKLIEWPDYDQAAMFQFNKVINEPDFLPLHVVRVLAQAATLMRAQRGKLVATPLGNSMLGSTRQCSLPAILFHIAFWRMDLGYFGHGLLGSWPQPDIGIVLWSLSVSASDWQTSEKLTRLCTIPEPDMLTGTWDGSAYAMQARILRPLLWFGLLEYRSEKDPDSRFAARQYYRKSALFDRLLAFDVKMDFAVAQRH